MTRRTGQRQGHAELQRQALLAAITGNTAEQMRLRIEGMASAGLTDHVIAAELQLHVDQVRRALEQRRA